MKIKKISWNNFLGMCRKEYPKEACGVLYSDKPYSDEESWIIFPITNVDQNPEEGWYFDSKELQKIKNQAKKRKLVRIGNVHTHCILEGEKFSEEFFEPSDTDLKFAQKYRDVVRGIVVLDDKEIKGMKFHDMFGNMSRIYFIKKEKKKEVKL